MEVRSVLRGLPVSGDELLGDPGVCVAVLDGPVDLSHPCFAGAAVERIDTLVREPAGPGPMSLHGTHVASLLFGQPGSPVAGLVPRCRGLILPVFPDGDETRVSQLDLARAIERAVQEGAHVINVSGGERTADGQLDAMLDRALRRCADSGVLVVAAVGNDGCECAQVPAAVPAVLAVGAAGPDGAPLATNNWGDAYAGHGVLAPGLDLEGAAPGAARRALTGSSFATPVVSGAVALLLSGQLRRGGEVDPAAAGRAVLATAAPAGSRGLTGQLDLARAYELITKAGNTVMTTSDAAPIPVAAEPVEPAVPDPPEPGVTAACAPGRACAGPTTPRPLVYAIGTIGFDFRTEARRDSFRQQMDRVPVPPAPDADAFTTVPANPYDPRQLSAYLARNPWASDKLTWTLNLDRTPIYALEAETPVGMAWGEPLVVDPLWTDEPAERDAYPPVSVVHKTFRDAIVGQALPVEDDSYVSRVSIPGLLTDRTVRLFSGQVVPVVEVKSRGIHTWNEAALVNAAADTVVNDAKARKAKPAVDERVLRQNIRALLDKVYYQFRNLGQSSADRAMNYAATNAFMYSNEIQSGLLSGKYVPGPDEGFYTLDTVHVSKSPYCRFDSDCQDVVITFFDPENDRRARVSYLFTIDVSDELPVSLAPSHRFLGGM